MKGKSKNRQPFIFSPGLVILITFLFLITTFKASGQLNVGIKAGTNITSLNYDNSLTQRPINTEVKIGYLGGLTFQHFVQEKIGIQFEIIFIQKGFKTEFDSVSNTQYERTINYISLPFLTHAYFGNDSYGVSLILGPYGSYALGSSEILTDGEVVTTRSYEYNTDIDNRFEFGLQGGVGIKKAFGFGIIEIQGQYAFTFTSLFKWGAAYNDPEKDRYFEVPEQAQNQGLQLSINYYYPF